MNKKGFGESLMLIISVIVIGLMIIVGIKIARNEEIKECEWEILRLKAINGISDMDTGFLSGGTTNQKNLLFDNNELISFEDRDIRNTRLIIGEDYNISRCAIRNTHTLWMDRNEKEIKLFAYGEKDE